ncbi:hypothetical protein PGTUg99_035063 [Puccinia graminis f. sp. tritici]|uniref:Uncharacterized protein n=1 Tax=Puccinia graminis f. sp. tritici TaxID=56615 RepID=A0A5B0SMC7_PUCGR|nr:hypothetical protein PGTUg99_035063 [Puccinia graminis f. sp. tritici]
MDCGSPDRRKRIVRTEPQRDMSARARGSQPDLLPPAITCLSPLEALADRLDLQSA